MEKVYGLVKWWNKKETILMSCKLVILTEEGCMLIRELGTLPISTSPSDYTYNIFGKAFLLVEYNNGAVNRVVFGPSDITVFPVPEFPEPGVLIACTWVVGSKPVDVTEKLSTWKSLHEVYTTFAFPNHTYVEEEYLYVMLSNGHLRKMRLEEDKKILSLSRYPLTQEELTAALKLTTLSDSEFEEFSSALKTSSSTESHNV